MGWLSRALLLASSAGLIQASSPPAAIYAFDSSSKGQPQNAASIRPETLRLIMAQRLGVSQYHSVEELDDSALGQVDALGGQRPLLLEDEQAAAKKAASSLVVIIDGLDSILDLKIPSGRTPAASLSDLPSPSATKGLVEAFSRQLSDSTSRLICNIEKKPDSGLGSQAIFTSETSADHCSEQLWSSWTGHGLKAIQSLDVPKRDANSNPKYDERVSELSSYLQTYDHLAKKGVQDTLVVLFAPSSSHTKRSDDAYGSYTLPRRRRSANPQSFSEEPLELPNDGFLSSNASQTRPPAHSTPTALPKGILPACYSSLDLCNANTNNCSGHGSCYQKAGHKGADEGRRDCFSCRCSATILRDEGKNSQKTIHWGGPACQKKDVSSPFFLLAGFTIVLVAAVSAAVGMLFSIGSEELPSVLGAGVGGAKPNR